MQIENNRPLYAVISDVDFHTNPDTYESVLEKARLHPVDVFSDTAFRNDRVLCKLDVFSTDIPLHDVQAVISDFKTENRDVISSGCADIRFITPTFAHDAGIWIPDCIDTKEPIDMDRKTVRTLFLRMDIPESAAAGAYTAELTLSCREAAPLVFRLYVSVLPYTLPQRPDTPFRLELWMYPYSAERYYANIDTKQYFGEDVTRLPFIHLTGKADDALRSQLKLYASAGGKAITVTCVEDPWNTQTYDPYPSMIKWHHHEDDSFSFDYTDFDKWVRLNMECGVSAAIKTFSIAAWGNRVTYINDDNSVSSEAPAPGSERWTKLWSSFLRDYMRHTEEMGWFDKTYISMDEREPEEIEAVLSLNDSIKNADGKSFKTALAVYRFDAAHLFDRIDDLSLALGMDEPLVKDIAQKRRLAGKTTTLYTCGPSCSALANEPYESEYSQLYTAKQQTDGFLRWALDSFNADPIASTAHRLFAAGDLYMIYPDHIGNGFEAHSSHRFEKIAAGIRDVLKIRVLADEKPECRERLAALLDSLGKESTDLHAEVRRVMNGVYRIAEE